MRSTLSTFNEIWQQQFRSSVLNDAELHYPQQKFLIGCSGGMDSMLLLQLMNLLFPQRIRAVYIDHQLQAPSAAWGEVVREFCFERQILCEIVAVQVQNGNLEQQARQARYAAFSQHIHKNEVLVLAHHQQDQAETLLLRLLSGSGVAGLSAMREHDVRDGLHIWRPMLNLSREQIEKWTETLHLGYVIDPTNADQHYDRAWCRETVWPLLQQRFPQMQMALARTTWLMQDANEILDSVLEQDWQLCCTPNQLNLAQFKLLSVPRQRQLLSVWLKGDGIYRPSLDAVQRLQREVIDAKADAQAVLFLKPYYFVRYQNQIHRLTEKQYLAVKKVVIVDEILNCKLQQIITTASGIYIIEQTNQMGLCFELLTQTLNLKVRQGGEKVHLYGRVGSWPLKKAIQAAQIFPWLRYQVQILAKDDVILGVFTPQGFWLAQSPYCQLGGWKPTQKVE
ncbi:tRNA lysidine(34) synthetase TilS [Acinetobacter sp. MD2]|uniref:tRNA lysidine(34) synthetase TilS n=1 Tax=Acinetobacter sp. MD2 TaxID=2600066 RepID=UPI002D1EAF95|nr:tRNA lysidine(34) synthetase TilS [Acinetobacter sp. MD2]MEB3767994.1 tRNA lysidine(34) synthetase TilS [Acinetobacter sp. MD2]